MKVDPHILAHAILCLSLQYTLPYITMPNTGDIDLRSLGLALLEMADAKPAKPARGSKTAASKLLASAPVAPFPVASAQIYDKIVAKAVELWTLKNPGKDAHETRKKWTKDLTVKGGLTGLGSGIAMRYVIQALNATNRNNGWIKELSKFDFAHNKIDETKMSYGEDERAKFIRYLQLADARIKSVA